MKSQKLRGWFLGHPQHHFQLRNPAVPTTSRVFSVIQRTDLRGQSYSPFTVFKQVLIRNETEKKTHFGQNSELKEHSQDLLKG